MATNGLHINILKKHKLISLAKIIIANLVKYHIYYFKIV